MVPRTVPPKLALYFSIILLITLVHPVALQEFPSAFFAGLPVWYWSTLLIFATIYGFVVLFIRELDNFDNKADTEGV